MQLDRNGDTVALIVGHPAGVRLGCPYNVISQVDEQQSGLMSKCRCVWSDMGEVGARRLDWNTILFIGELINDNDRFNQSR